MSLLDKIQITDDNDRGFEIPDGTIITVGDKIEPIEKADPAGTQVRPYWKQAAERAKFNPGERKIITPDEF